MRFRRRRIQAAYAISTKMRKGKSIKAVFDLDGISHICNSYKPKLTVFPKHPENHVGHGKNYVLCRKNYIRHNSNYIRSFFRHCKRLKGNSLQQMLFFAACHCENQRLMQSKCSCCFFGRKPLAGIYHMGHIAIQTFMVSYP